MMAKTTMHMSGEIIVRDTSEKCQGILLLLDCGNAVVEMSTL